MKRLIILVCTISLSTQSEVKSRERLREYRNILESTFNQELQDETNTIIRTIVLPCKGEQETKMECIYPVCPTPEIMTKLEEIRIKQNDWKL